MQINKDCNFLSWWEAMMDCPRCKGNGCSQCIPRDLLVVVGSFIFAVAYPIVLLTSTL